MACCLLFVLGRVGVGILFLPTKEVLDQDEMFFLAMLGVPSTLVFYFQLLLIPL